MTGEIFSSLGQGFSLGHSSQRGVLITATRELSIPYEFEDYLSILQKKALNFDRDCVESVDRSPFLP